MAKIWNISFAIDGNGSAAVEADSEEEKAARLRLTAIKALNELQEMQGLVSDKTIYSNALSISFYGEGLAREAKNRILCNGPDVLQKV